MRGLQDFEISKIHFHKDFDAKTKLDDIALIELDRTVEFTRSVRPACLSQNFFVEGKILAVINFH